LPARIPNIGPPGVATRLTAIIRAAAHARPRLPGIGTQANLKRPLANLVKHDINQLTRLIKTRLRQMQYRPGLLEGFLAKPGLDLRPLR
jgi:hypothetical protein